MQEDIAKILEDKREENEEANLDDRCKEITSRLVEVAETFRKDG